MSAKELLKSFKQFKLSTIKKNIDPRDRNIILFPGAANVYRGIGTDLLCIKEAEETFKKASDILKFDLLSLCLRGSKENSLDILENRHLAAFVTSHAALSKLEHEYPRALDWVTGVTGEDVGIFNALVYAGCLSFETALDIIKLRAQAMTRASEIIPSAQIMINLRPATQKHKICIAAKNHCIKLGIPESIAVCSITKYIGLSRIQVGGHQEAIKYLTQEGTRLFEFRDVKLMPGKPAYNTVLMKPVEELLDCVLNNEKTPGEEDLNLPTRCRLYSMCDGKEHKEIDQIRRDLVSHVCKPIKFEQTIQCIYKRESSLAQPNTFVMWDRDMLKQLNRVNGRAGRSAKLITA